MQITLYLRTYPVEDAPVAASFEPFPKNQVYTLTRGDDVYEAEYAELRVEVPDGSVVDVFERLLRWHSERASVRSTAKEVLDLARSHAPGFRTV